MGLFSSKKKVTVTTAVVRVIEDNLLPHTHKASVLDAIVNGGEVTESLLEGLKRSVAVRADNMYEYGRTQYHYGLPNHSFLEKGSGKGTIKAAIEREIGASVNVLYYHFAPINSVHQGWKELIEKYGYNHLTNEITTLSKRIGHPVYLDDIKAVFTKETVEVADPEVFENWGSSALVGFANHRRGQGLFQITGYIQHSPWSVDESLEEDVVELHYSWSAWEPKQVGPYETVEEVFYSDKIIVPMGGYETDTEYFQAMYQYSSGGRTKLGCWTYLDNSGVYPEVDAIYEVNNTELGSYFPFVFFQVDGVNQGGADFEFKSPYETSKKLVNYLGLDYKQMAKDISRAGGSELVQAVMIMAVPANGDSPVECRYLFEYFDRMFENGAVDPTWPVPPKSDSGGILRKTGLAIAIKDADFQVTLRYSGIGKRTVAGSIGNVGTCSRTEGTETSYTKYTNAASGAIGSTPVSSKYIGYTKQVSDTFYEEVRVYDLTMLYPIKGKYGTSAKGSSNKLLVPLDKSITDTMPTTMKEELYCRSLNYVFNTYVETEIKWYTQSWFKIVLIIIAVVITIFSFGTGSPAVWTTLAALNAATIALIWVWIKSFIVSMFVKFAITEVAKALGPEWAIAIAIVGMAVGVYGYMGDATWATNLLQMSTSMMSAAGDMYQQGIKDIMNSFGELQLLSDAASETLKETQALLGMQDLLNPFAFIGQVPEIRFGETPDDFFTRTIHAGNIGTASLEVASNYVTMSLKLPTLEQSVEEFQDEYF
jgi:hypothetical protein